MIFNRKKLFCSVLMPMEHPTVILTSIYWLFYLLKGNHFGNHWKCWKELIPNFQLIFWCVTLRILTGVTGKVTR